MLGANINVYGGEQSISIYVNTLARNFESTIALVEEMLFEPRWDEEQFELAKSRIINSHKRNQANSNFLAFITFHELAFGKGNLMAIPDDGTIETIEAITLDDLNIGTYWYAPKITKKDLAGKVVLVEIWGK